MTTKNQLINIYNSNKYENFIDKIIERIEKDGTIDVCWHDIDIDLWKVILYIFEKELENYRRRNSKGKNKKQVWQVLEPMLKKYINQKRNS